MTPLQTIILVAVVVAVVVLAGFAWAAYRRRELRKRFGPEYDRVIADTNNRAAAERELRDRERRYASLALRPLLPQSQQRYAAAWSDVQARFIDSPHQAVDAADDLVTQLVAECGYPTSDFDDQLATLSVEHATTLGHYRDAHEISLRNQRGEATTEELRQALVHHRALFTELLGQDPVRVGDPDHKESR